MDSLSTFVATCETVIALLDRIVRVAGNLRVAKKQGEELVSAAIGARRVVELIRTTMDNRVNDKEYITKMTGIVQLTLMRLKDLATLLDQFMRNLVEQSTIRIGISNALGFVERDLGNFANTLATMTTVLNTSFLTIEQGLLVDLVKQVDFKFAVKSAVMPPSTFIEDTPFQVNEISFEDLQIQFKPVRRTTKKEVYLATFQAEVVAVEVLRGDLIPTEQLLNDFRKEIRIATTLTNKHIVQVYAVCRDKNDPTKLGIVMENMEGNLRDLLKTNANLDWRTKINIASHIAQGLRSIHSKQIMHGNLTSGSVFYDERWIFKIGNFAASKFVVGLISDRDIRIDTELAWLAPELIAITPIYSTKADIYSLGILLWEIATQNLPRTLYSMKNKQRESTEGIPADFARLIEDCWAINPEERPTIFSIITTLENLKKSPLYLTEPLSPKVPASPALDTPDSTTYVPTGQKLHNLALPGPKESSEETVPFQPTNAQLTKAEEDLQAHWDDIQKISGFKGASVGIKVTNGQLTDQVAIRIHVEHKESDQALSHLSKDKIVPHYYNETITDVFDGEFTNASLLTRFRELTGIGRTSDSTVEPKLAHPIPEATILNEIPVIETDWNAEQNKLLIGRVNAIIHALPKTLDASSISALQAIISEIQAHLDSCTKIKYWDKLFQDGCVCLGFENLYKKLAEWCAKENISMDNDEQAIKKAILADIAYMESKQANIVPAINGNNFFRDTLACTVNERIKQIAQAHQNGSKAPEEEKFPLYAFGTLQYLCKGTFGAVYAGSLRDGTPVALKLMTEIPPLSATSKKEFDNEVNISQRLRSPHIVTFYGAFTKQDFYFMVMELMTGGNLTSLLRNKQIALPWHKRLQMAIEIAKGIEYIHKNLVLHRDLKTQNVLLDADYHCKIADFGFGIVKTESSRLASEGKLCGTVEYLAPELIEEIPHFSYKSDIYAYSIILWEIMTRQVPYEKTIPFVIPSLVKMGTKLQFPERYNDTLVTPLICECWGQSPDKRPSVDEIIFRLSHMQASIFPTPETVIDCAPS